MREHLRRRLYTYESEEIVVTWDFHRCTKFSACTRTLPSVFDSKKRPWIDPTQASADEIAAACEACPTGALHYERKDGGPTERTPARNTITVAAGGPLYVKGNVRITDTAGETMLEDTRAALCRCGRSHNLPLCDGYHEKVKFKAAGAPTESQRASGSRGESEGGELLVRAIDPGPLTVWGAVEICSEDRRGCVHARVAALCSCGRSKNKPFCDGRHAES
jgi:CDGSH-type Zn-finger protein/uncharacterized Fe-S cluster protein YjdI